MSTSAHSPLRLPIASVISARLLTSHERVMAWAPYDSISLATFTSSCGEDFVLGLLAAVAEVGVAMMVARVVVGGWYRRQRCTPACISCIVYRPYLSEEVLATTNCDDLGCLPTALSKEFACGTADARGGASDQHRGHLIELSVCE